MKRADMYNYDEQEKRTYFMLEVGKKGLEHGLITEATFIKEFINNNLEAFMTGRDNVWLLLRYVSEKAIREHACKMLQEYCKLAAEGVGTKEPAFTMQDIETVLYVKNL